MWQECNPGDNRAPLSNEQEPFTGEPVPADRAENTSAAKRKKSHGRQMNRNATWPAEKGGSTSHRHGKQMNRNAAWPAEKVGHAVTDLEHK